MREKLEALKSEALDLLEKAENRPAIEELKRRFVGKKGAVRDLLSSMKDVPREERPVMGKLVNEVKSVLENAFSKKLESHKDKEKTTPRRDLSLPGLRRRRGRLHPITRTIREMTVLFERLGFSVVEGPEIETERNNFDMLNIPAEHPSHDPFDTFYVNFEPDMPNYASEKFLLRSHTSPVQIRALLKEKPPVRVVAPGRTFRPDRVDATHYHTFHQMEGLAVDEDITFADLKAILALLAEGIFGPETKTRLRPSFFPFTEPSAELDVSCFLCGGRNDRCPVCKGTGWIEMGGCGMVHPNVLRNAGVDAERYTGFAFGMGVERIALLRYGIDDIRLFISAGKGNDLRFLTQFV